MSHGITEVDAGIVWGTTWHKLPQYRIKTSPVTYEEAYGILNFPLKKQVLYRKLPDGTFTNAQAYEVVRADSGECLVPHVGSRFEVIGNEKLLEHVSRTILKEYPQLQIESVGTLWGGATTFVNLKVDSFVVKGDISPTINRIMWWNPLGKGGYRTCAHNVRVVCANTLGMAAREGKEAGSSRTIAHVKSGGIRIAAELDNLAKHFLELESLTKTLQQLATVKMSGEEPQNFLRRFLPIPGTLEKDDPIAAEGTTAFKLRTRINDQYQSASQGLTQDVQHSRYGMLQAVTTTLDHDKVTPSRDQGNIAWDGIVGRRAEQKQSALNILSTVDKM